MIKGIKKAVLQAGKFVALQPRVANSNWRGQRLAILCYHCISVDDEHEWDPRFTISPATLEQRFRLLRDERYNVLGLGEAVKRLYDGTLPPRSVAITFDDGGYDFYKQAWPLLRKFSFPATVYLTTFYCYHRKPIFGMLCYYLMWKGRNSFPGGRLKGLSYEPDLSTEASRMRAAAEVIAEAEGRGLRQEEKDAVAEELAGQLRVDFQAILDKRILQLMNPEEVAHLASEGLDIQLHTHRHRTPLDRDLFVRELLDNRRYIREMTGSDEHTTHFCYPSGVHMPEFLPWLTEQKVVSATTCESGLASVKSNPLLLPRIVDTSCLSELEFESWISGVSEAAKGRVF